MPSGDHLELRGRAGTVERDRTGVVDHAAERHDRAVGDRHRAGIVGDRLLVEEEVAGAEFGGRDALHGDRLSGADGDDGIAVAVIGDDEIAERR